MTEPLRVAIFTESYLPYLSGVTVATDALARGLARAGHEVLLVAPRPASGAGAGTADDRLRIAWLPSYQGPPPAPPGYRMPWPVPSEALREAGDFRADVVHAQSPFVSGLMARRVARRSGAPLVFTHHTRFGDYRHYLGPMARPGAWLLGAYLRRWWAGCAAVVAPGSALAAEISARVGRAGRPLVRSIPTGIEVARIARLEGRDPRRLAGWPPDARVVVSVGRLAPEKNVELLLDAVALAAARDPRLRLLLIGGGPATASAVERARQTDLEGRVHLTGQLSRDDALALASGADLFAFASQTETQGLVLAEALAAGLPVVALSGPGVSDAIRDGVDGMLVDPRPPGGAAERLGRAIGLVAADEGRRAQMAAAARAGAERFDAARRIDDVVALYRDVLTLETGARRR